MDEDTYCEYIAFYSQYVAIKLHFTFQELGPVMTIPSAWGGSNELYSKPAHVELHIVRGIELPFAAVVPAGRYLSELQ